MPTRLTTDDSVKNRLIDLIESLGIPSHVVEEMSSYDQHVILCFLQGLQFAFRWEPLDDGCCCSAEKSAPDAPHQRQPGNTNSDVESTEARVSRVLRFLDVLPLQGEDTTVYK